MSGDGVAKASIFNASLDMGFKIVRVPKGIVELLAQDPEGPFRSSLKLFEKYKNSSLKRQLDSIISSRTETLSPAAANAASKVLPPVSNQIDWGEDVRC
jgi:hypothetical protein